tara:strand:+ start:2113 stop:2469 length:357 start_codon:yes stop_codon:yes gene_type:complete
MEYNDIERMYLSSSEETKKLVEVDIECGDKFAEEILAMITEDDSGLDSVLQYPQIRGLLSMVINNSKVLETAMLSDPIETARALQLLMYSAIIFERQQVASRELINKEVQDILDKEDE